MDNYIESKVGNGGNIVDLTEVCGIEWVVGDTETDNWTLKYRYKGGGELLWKSVTKDEALHFIKAWKETRAKDV